MKKRYRTAFQELFGGAAGTASKTIGSQVHTTNADILNALQYASSMDATSPKKQMVFAEQPAKSDAQGGLDAGGAMDELLDEIMLEEVLGPGVGVFGAHAPDIDGEHHHGVAGNPHTTGTPSVHHGLSGDINPIATARSGVSESQTVAIDISRGLGDETTVWRDGSWEKLFARR